MKTGKNTKPQTNTIKWFEREFHFGNSTPDFKLLLQRLNSTFPVYKGIVEKLPEQYLSIKPDSKWSIKEHIGHLSLLEPVWLQRFTDIVDERQVMSAVDLNNTATAEAHFNRLYAKDLLEIFRKRRNNTIQFLEQRHSKDFEKKSRHPRLNKPMRIIDLMYFVAEHDDHHLNSIQTIISQK